MWEQLYWDVPKLQPTLLPGCWQGFGAHGEVEGQSGTEAIPSLATPGFAFPEELCPYNPGRTKIHWGSFLCATNP